MWNTDSARLNGYIEQRLSIKFIIKKDKNIF
jgi:hypothetical protein